VKVNSGIESFGSIQPRTSGYIYIRVCSTCYAINTVSGKQVKLVNASKHDKLEVNVKTGSDIRVV